VKYSWYNPRNGEYLNRGKLALKETMQFDPPGEEKEGNDWVLQISFL